jgi:anti-sigma factor RsiW
MTTQPPLRDDEREDLVAYLDGEVDARTAQSIELKLSQDPRYRAEAASLSKSWSLLDRLPASPPTANFTSRTLERVSALRPAASPAGAGRRWRSWALAAAWAASVLLAAVLGFATVGRWLGTAHLPKPAPKPTPAEADEQLARDLRVIENQRLYDQVQNIDFLRKLAEPDLFGDEG